MKKFLLVIPILLFVISACNVGLTQTQPTTTPIPPLTEADVPRITVEEAKRASDEEKAVIVDVRSAEAYAEGHMAGAISVPLDQIERDAENLPLKKDKWIITYCT